MACAVLKWGCAQWGSGRSAEGAGLGGIWRTSVAAVGVSERSVSEGVAAGEWEEEGTWWDWWRKLGLPVRACGATGCTGVRQ